MACRDSSWRPARADPEEHGSGAKTWCVSGIISPEKGDVVPGRKDSKTGRLVTLCIPIEVGSQILGGLLFESAQIVQAEPLPAFLRGRSLSIADVPRASGKG